MIYQQYGDNARAEADATAEHAVTSASLLVAKAVDHIDCTLSVAVRSGAPEAVAEYLTKEAETYAEAKGGRWSASHVYSKPLPADPSNGLLYSISMQRLAV
jgi:hypothetical protein